MRFNILLPVLVLLGYTCSWGQICGTPDPDLQSPKQEWFNYVAAGGTYQKTHAIRTIPVAVHVIYHRENDDHNISNAQIQSQIDLLNNDFSGLGGLVDTEVRFCLAGINRVKSRRHHEVTIGNNDVEAKALSQADPHRYLNIWVVDELNTSAGNGVLGYAQFPMTLGISPQTDGVMIPDHYFGNTGTAANSSPFNLGRTTTHEVGHWLNLFHTFSAPGCDNSGNCDRIADCCCDTPPQNVPTYGCPQGLNSCNTDSPDLPDPIENFLSYSDDACMSRFTQCQSSRINLCLDSVRTQAWFIQGDCPPFKNLPAFPKNPEPDELQIGPNPTSGSFQCKFLVERKETTTISILNLQGKAVALLFQGELTEGPITQNFSISVHKGMYLLKVESASRRLYKKLEIQ